MNCQKKFSIVSALFFAATLVACGSSSSSGGGDVSLDGPDALSFVVGADFSSSAAASLAVKLSKTTTGQCADRTDLTKDGPTLTDGLDCDGDNGFVAHITPSRYVVALKRATLVPADVAGTDAASVDLIADTGTLAKSKIIVMTTDNPSETVDTFDLATLPQGVYSGVEAELYYYEMTFPVAGVTRNVRIYMSDDDFEAEGNLGHHQGDITYINDAGTELGWVNNTWTETSATRDQEGAGGTDPKTGHVRGFFGNEEFWTTTDILQSATQDIFVQTLDFETPLDLSSGAFTRGATTVTLSAVFSTADTFYYEDFAPLNTTEAFPGFYPGKAEEGGGGEAKSDEDEWAPLTPSATVSFSAISAL